MDAARRTGIPILYVVVRFRTGYPEISLRNATFARIPEMKAFTKGDPSADIHPNIAPQEGDTVVTKRRVSAFTGSDLEVVLRSLGAETLVLSGISTSGVVLSTLRQAADLDYRITVLEDLCMDPDPEVHRMLTQKIFPTQATVVSAEKWVSQLA